MEITKLSFRLDPACILKPNFTLVKPGEVEVSWCRKIELDCEGLAITLYLNKSGVISWSEVELLSGTNSTIMALIDYDANDQAVCVELSPISSTVVIIDLQR